jgi:hypothetical protein
MREPRLRDAEHRADVSRIGLTPFVVADVLEHVVGCTIPGKRRIRLSQRERHNECLEEISPTGERLA